MNRRTLLLFQWLRNCSDLQKNNNFLKDGCLSKMKLFESILILEIDLSLIDCTLNSTFTSSECVSIDATLQYSTAACSSLHLTAWALLEKTCERRRWRPASIDVSVGNVFNRHLNIFTDCSGGWTWSCIYQLWNREQVLILKNVNCTWDQY